jgi:ADP-ribose pyrophosphatase YjhB (NUDIX family)
LWGCEQKVTRLRDLEAQLFPRAAEFDMCSQFTRTTRWDIVERMTSVETFHLPDFGSSDCTAAICCNSDAVLLMRHLGHRGLYHVFPGGPAHHGEGVEAACARTALEAIRKAARELAGQLESEDLINEIAGVSILRKVAAHPWTGATYHYFLASVTGKSPLLDPTFQLQVDRSRHKLGVWMPYAWVACDRLSRINLQPEEAVGICRQLLDHSMLPQARQK